MKALGEGGLRVGRRVAAVAMLGGAIVTPTALTPAAADQVRAIIDAVTGCHSSAACAGGVQGGTGLGVEGVAARNNGVDGATKNPSATFGYGRSGVYGHDDSTDGGGLNVGVAGYSLNGYGMQATSPNGIGLLAGSNAYIGTYSSGGSFGVVGESTSTNGIGVGSSGTLAGTQGLSSSGIGVKGFSSYGTGVYGSSTSGDAVDAYSTNGLGLYVKSDNSVGILARVAAGSQREALELQGGTADRTGYAIETFDSGTGLTFYVDNGGNAFVPGLFYTGGGCWQGCSRTHRVVSYAPRESAPSMEDVGEGQLVDGEARVSIDPAFRNVMDQHATYVVFLSPEGPNHGLYVTRKSTAGFTVAENPGGHSTIAFGYRIVAKPYGVTAARLPMTELSMRPTQASFKVSPPLVPRRPR